MAVCGYPVWDLANKKEFVDEGLRRLDRIQRATSGKKIAVVLGFIDKGKSADSLLLRSPADKDRAKQNRSRNALAWIENGKIRTKYYKQLLPTYDVFLEEIFLLTHLQQHALKFHEQNSSPHLQNCEFRISFDK
jgi:predicted amidohydrolase